MYYSIELLFDESSEAIVRKLWSGISDEKINDFMNLSNGDPHISLVILETDEINNVIRIAEDYFSSVKQFEVTFDSVGSFPGDEGVVYLSPVITEHLLKIHKGLLEKLSHYSQNIWGYYQVNKWSPHCTIALKTERDKMAKAFEFIRNNFVPFTATMTRIEIVTLPECEVLKLMDLKS
jgi:2'-5' RNA ligase